MEENKYIEYMTKLFHEAVCLSPDEFELFCFILLGKTENSTTEGKAKELIKKVKIVREIIGK